MKRARIVGTGMAVPERVLTNADLEKMVDTTDEWIVTRTGIRERRIAGDGETLFDFALPAAERALEMAGIAGSEVDLVICATFSSDLVFPTTSARVQAAIGAGERPLSTCPPPVPASSTDSALPTGSCAQAAPKPRSFWAVSSSRDSPTGRIAIPVSFSGTVSGRRC